MKLKKIAEDSYILEIGELQIRNDENEFENHGKLFFFVPLQKALDIKVSEFPKGITITLYEEQDGCMVQDITLTKAEDNILKVVVEDYIYKKHWNEFFSASAYMYCKKSIIEQSPSYTLIHFDNTDTPHFLLTYSFETVGQTIQDIRKEWKHQEKNLHNHIMDTLLVFVTNEKASIKESNVDYSTMF